MQMISTSSMSNMPPMSSMGSMSSTPEMGSLDPRGCNPPMMFKPGYNVSSLPQQHAQTQRRPC